ncbi:MAG: 3'-5' exoribonuclease, partial [Chloroflexi bacterium]|nr:3'-5' exoribonuclease [Chloroflexota bacterium]
MATTYVALDLETTGLDPQQDEIIEVGAVKFTETGVLDTFHALVKPRRPLPYAIQLLTGITSQDLQDAPPFAVIAGDLLLFLGQHHLVGQNASFDLSFLARAGLELRNPVFDTLELSKILLPRLPERNLTALAGHLGVSYPVKHRAVADATATRAVFLALWQRAQALDPRVLAPLSNLGASTGWALGGLFQEALLERMAGATSAPHAPAPPTAQAPSSPLAADTQPAAEPAPAAGLPAVAGQSQRPLDVDLLSRIIGPAGPLARALSGFEHRQEQVAMLQAVAEAFNAREHLLVEAGTGTGKSLAYLLPAVCQAAQNNTRVVISTNTIGLQEQIVTKDIPLLLGALSAAQEETPAQGAPSVDRLRVAQLKGRSNYLCARRWSAFTSGGLGDLDPTFLARLVVWAATTETGDRAELNLNNTDLAAWSRVSAQSENCPATQCLMFRSGGCFLQQARQRAAAAHLVVVNHALLVSDLITDNKVLPEHDYLVVDEAHHLEDVATDQLGFRAGPWDFYGLLDRLSQESAGRRRQGFLPSLEAAAQSGGPLFATQSALLEQSSALQGRLASVRSRTEGLFATLAQYLREHGEGSAEYGRRVRLTGGARRQPLWSQVEQAWEDLRLTLQDVGDRLERLVTGMEALSGGQLEHYEDLLAEAAGLLFTCQELQQQGNAIIARADPAWVCWLAATGQSEGVGLYAAPLEVGTVLQRDLFAKKASVVLTSATLQTSGSF